MVNIIMGPCDGEWLQNHRKKAFVVAEMLLTGRQGNATISINAFQPLRHMVNQKLLPPQETTVTRLGFRVVQVTHQL